MIRDDISKALQDAVTALGYTAPEFITLEHPADLTHGDYACNIAMILGKEAGKSPRELAEAIVAHVVLPHGIAELSVAGPGFINVRCARTYFRDMVREVLRDATRWGANESQKSRRVLVEHTQPNPFKPFHIGHLMSNTIGESIARLYDFAGAEVRRANYQGDVGLHVAKTLWGLVRLQGNPRSIEDLGNAYVFGNHEYEDNPSAKQEIIAYNKMVYEHADEIAEMYKAGREASLEHFDALYRMLGTKFDYYFFESESQKPGRALVKEGLTQGVFEESDGAVVFRGEWHGLHTRVFITREGLPTYEAKELGLAQLKAEKWPFDLSITTTAVEQAEYFKVVFTALTLLRPELAGKFLHIPHGMMMLTTGKMSSRKGNVITGESLLTDMEHEARNKVEGRDLSDEEKTSIASDVAVSAIKYSVLKQKAGKNIAFDPERSLSFDGDSGPYLQYAYTRASSVLKKAEAEGVQPSTELAPQEVTSCERLLVRFPEVVARAQENHEPHHITTYLIDLASTFNQWYANEKILDGSPVAPYKLAVTQAVAHTLKNGLWLLGIHAPERM
jgi:arginyl-tRNA synthetase